MFKSFILCVVERTMKRDLGKFTYAIGSSNIYEDKFISVNKWSIVLL